MLAVVARIGLGFGAAPTLRYVAGIFDLGCEVESIEFDVLAGEARIYGLRLWHDDAGASSPLLELEYASVDIATLELLRANQWNHATIQRGWVRPAFGFRRLLIEPEGDQEALRAAWLPQYEAWAATLPEAARARQLDLAFVEHLLPNTLGVRHWGDPGNFIMNPFADPELIRLAMQIPPERRDQDEPNRWLLENNCAHLADIPFEREVAVGSKVPEEEPD